MANKKGNKKNNRNAAEIFANKHRAHIVRDYYAQYSFHGKLYDVYVEEALSVYYLTIRYNSNSKILAYHRVKKTPETTVEAAIYIAFWAAHPDKKDVKPERTASDPNFPVLPNTDSASIESDKPTEESAESPASDTPKEEAPSVPITQEAAVEEAMSDIQFGNEDKTECKNHEVSIEIRKVEQGLWSAVANDVILGAVTPWFNNSYAAQMSIDTRETSALNIPSFGKDIRIESGFTSDLSAAYWLCSALTEYFKSNECNVRVTIEYKVS